MKKSIGLIILSFVISACAANPYKVEVKKQDDYYMNCNQLSNEIQKAEHYKKEARKEDRFKLRYMMPLNAIISTININRAEGKAVKRIVHLKEVMTRKGCFARNNGQVNNRTPPGGYNGYR